MPMKIGVLTKSTSDALSQALKVLLPDALIIGFQVAPDVVQTLPPALQTERAKLLSRCDYLLTTQLGPEYGRFATDALRQTAQRLHEIPELAFGGFHPDACILQADGNAVPSATGVFHSRIAVAGYLAGLSVLETAALYNRLVFARLGYFDAFPAECRAMQAEWSRCGLAAEPVLARWLEKGCFVYTPNRPKPFAVLDLARAACEMMGISAAARDLGNGDAGQPGLAAAALPDSFAEGPLLPVFPDIAAAIGVAPEGCFSGGTAADGAREILDTSQFIRRSYGHFAAVPSASLLENAGVAEALAALGLQVRMRVRPRTETGPAMALLSYHGTVLRAGPGAAQIRHVPLRTDAAGALVLANCTQAGAAQRDAGLADAAVAFGEPAMVVHFVRRGAFLCAEQGRDTADFDRARAGNWESFLPILPADVETLRQIVAADWSLLSSGEVIYRDMIRIADGFTLQFGRWTVNLIHCFPELAPDGSLSLVLNGEPVVVQRASLQQGTPALSPNAALSTGKRVVLAGAPCFLPPPVTMCDADRAWVYRAAQDTAALDGRAQQSAAVLRREFDQAIEGLAPGATEVCVRFASGAGPLAWMEAAVRLHILSTLVPAGAAFLAPPDLDEETLRVWIALGFGELRLQRAQDGAGRAGELIWLENGAISTFPAEALAGLRARVGTPPATGRRLFWTAGLAPAPVLEGFEAIAEDVPIGRQVGLIAEASHVVARRGAAPLAFCGRGTRVIEISDEAAFDVQDWMLCAKLGVMHGVVPCKARGDLLLPDHDKVSSLLRVMAARS